jgi:cytochrome c biogenesis protein CcmG, thiol:disulfide interchange protein DsbE
VKGTRTALWTAVAVGVALLALVGVLATRKDYESKLVNSPLLGRPAPELIGTSLTGDPVQLSTMRGKWVVVNFFATWCVPCQREHPEFVKFAARHRAAGDADVVMVIWDDEVGRVRDFFSENGGDWPVLADAGGEVALEFGVRGPPESYVVDPDGIVRAKAFEIRADVLDDIISGRPVS